MGSIGGLLEFTDERYVQKLSEFPMKHPMLQLTSILPAQLRRKTGEIRIPPEAQAGDYDLVVVASPTWWFNTSMPIRSYLESPEAKTVHEREAVRVRVDLAALLQRSTSGSRRSSASGTAGVVDETHFVCAGGQVKSMLAWLGYMKHGEPQERVIGLKMYPPNLKPDFEEQARRFVDGVLDRVVGAPDAAGEADARSRGAIVGPE